MYFLSLFLLFLTLVVGTVPYWLGAAQFEAGGNCSVEHEDSSYRQEWPLMPSYTWINLWLITGKCHSQCCVNISDEDGVSSPFWTIGLVHGQNLYGVQAVAHAACNPHSTALTESKVTIILLLFGASHVAIYLPERWRLQNRTEKFILWVYSQSLSRKRVFCKAAEV